MQQSGQNEFFKKIRSALGHPPESRRDVDLFHSEITDQDRSVIKRIRQRSAEERQQLLGRLMEMAVPINLNVIPVADQAAAGAAIVDLVKQKDPEWGDKKSVVTWRHPLIDGLNLKEALAGFDVPVYVIELDEEAALQTSFKEQRALLRQQVIDAYIGVTAADFCMADTATLVTRTRAGQARSVSLVPSIHVAVINLKQIVADLKELFAILKWGPQAQKEGLTNCMTFISGPSKTADIEATMVHGAHGPREVYIFVVEAD
jgi:L-lactate dehydrogenase complex protein LldG